MPVPTPTTDAGTSLSALLRSATRAAHSSAEREPFVEQLMRGELGLDAYVDLLAQHRHVYAALEHADGLLRADPESAELVVDGLARSAAIEADLATLLGPTAARPRVLPETERYVARLHEVVGRWVGGYAAHAYTRYLGDLSGGQAIKAVLQRSYGLPAAAVGFYTFATIPKPKPFKDEYRARLDRLRLDADERVRVAEEACLAFELNADVFRGLGRTHRPSARG
ncbi:biliverdin-producing heme oxygenase [Cellulomonas sp. APG4]|nr:biliverdin-producing heme oxygenase [Cellulomonas sp. APG4]